MNAFLESLTSKVVQPMLIKIFKDGGCLKNPKKNLWDVGDQNIINWSERKWLELQPKIIHSQLRGSYPLRIKIFDWGIRDRLFSPLDLQIILAHLLRVRIRIALRPPPFLSSTSIFSSSVPRAPFPARAAPAPAPAASHFQSSCSIQLQLHPLQLFQQ